MIISVVFRVSLTDFKNFFEELKNPAAFPKDFSDAKRGDCLDAVTSFAIRRFNCHSAGACSCAKEWYD